MPKMKTHKGIAKRVKITGTGKVLFKQTGARHLAIRKSRSNKLRKRKYKQLLHTYEKTVHKMMPYGGGQ